MQEIGYGNMEEEIKKIEEYAIKNNIPIMQKDGIEFLLKYIKENKVKKILEIGTAIGYSSIRMALLDEDIFITTIERDEERYIEAKNNINKFNLQNRINLIFKDALEVELNDKYDLIFIDAAKGKNRDFFEHFEGNLTSDGYIITDNMYFHGYVEMPEEEIPSKNILGIVRKIKDYINYLKTSIKYETTFYDKGDGISVTHKK